MNGFSFGIFQVLALLFIVTPALAANAIGKVTDIAGSATVTRAADKTTTALGKGNEVFQGDFVETATDGRAVIKFADGAELVMSGSGRLALDKYIYDPDKPEAGSADLGIFGAAFSYVGGLMEKKKGADVRLRMDFGSIGIRGTTVYGAMKNGVNWVFLEEGKALVRNDSGEADLVAGFGTSIIAKDEMPRPPYLWGPDQIEWIKRAVADPATLTTPAMAFYRDEDAKDGKEVKAKTMRQRAAESPSAGSAPGAKEQVSMGEAAGAAAPARARPASPPSPAAAVDAVSEQSGGQDIFVAESLAPQTIGVKILPEEDGAVRVETIWPVTVNIAEVDVSSRKLQDTVLWYQADLKSSGISGMAYLEMWVRFPGDKGGYFFSRGLDNMLTDAGDWKTYRTPFILKKGQVPDRVVMNLVIKGSGSVSIRGVKLQAGTQ